MSAERERIGLTLADFHGVVGMSRESFKQRLNARAFLLPSWDWGWQPLLPKWNRYRFDDALAIELASELADERGMPFRRASEIVLWSAALYRFLDRSNPLTDPKDFWIAELGGRHTEGDGRSVEHMSGSLAEVISAATKLSPAKIIMANVWAADRRLRRRASDLGIEIVDDEFVAPRSTAKEDDDD